MAGIDKSPGDLAVGKFDLAWFNEAAGRFMQGFLAADYNSARWRKADPRRPNVLCLWAPLAGRATRSELLEQPWSHWADRFAQQAPLKMLLPLMMSLGASLIIVAGPVMAKFLMGGLGNPFNLEQPQQGQQR